MSESYEWFEIWILVALLMAAKGRGTGVSLARLIATADFINHAIITREELEVGLGRLIDTGYVSKSPRGFRATRRAVSMWSKSAAKRSYVHTAWRAVEEAVGERPGPRSAPKTARQKIVSKSDYAFALKEYRTQWTEQVA
jgi:hypothetical protein